MTVQESVVPVARRTRRRTTPVPIVDRRALVLPLPPALESLFGLIAEPVLRFETSSDGRETLREIGILLGDILDLLEEVQAITQAADRLYDAAYGLEEARAHQLTNVSITPSLLKSRTGTLYRSLGHFREQLCSAKPSARARAYRTAW